MNLIFGLLAYKKRPHIFIYISIKEHRFLIELLKYLTLSIPTPTPHATSHNITLLLGKLENLHLLAVEFSHQ